MLEMTRVGVLGTLALLASACTVSESDHVLVKSDGCGTLDECSIADGACQKAILEITACVRGDDSPPLPPIRTLTRDQYRDELTTPDDSSSEMADEASLLAAASLEKTLEALHLVTTEGSLTQAAVDEQSTSTAAYYREKQKDVTVIADTTMNKLGAMNELAHEFTHYLQDRAGQIEVGRPQHGSSDLRVARRALIEGEAVINSYRVTAQMMGLSARNVRWSTLFSRIESSTNDATNGSKSPFVVAVNQLPYALSPSAIELAWEQAGRERVDGLFDHPPVTELDWLTGLPQTSLQEELGCNPPLPPDGFELIGADTFGVTGLYALLGTHGDATLNASSAWRQDVIAVYRAKDAADGDDVKVLAVWRMRLRDEASAMSLASNVTALGLAVTRDGRELSISVSSDPDQEPISGDALAACPTEEQLIASLPESQRMQASLRGWSPPSRFFSAEHFGR